MKQFITEEQFNELSKIHKEIWLKFCRRNKYVQYDKGGNNFMLVGFPSIGEMISFLDEQYTKGNRFSLSIERCANGWVLWETGDEEKELCDALWEAIKHILNNE